MSNCWHKIILTFIIWKLNVKRLTSILTSIQIWPWLLWPSYWSSILTSFLFLLDLDFHFDLTSTLAMILTLLLTAVTVMVKVKVKVKCKSKEKSSPRPKLDKCQTKVIGQGQNRSQMFDIGHCNDEGQNNLNVERFDIQHSNDEPQNDVKPLWRSTFECQTSNFLRLRFKYWSQRTNAKPTSVPSVFLAWRFISTCDLFWSNGYALNLQINKVSG